MNAAYLKEIRYGVGLDIGIASVGWAIVVINEADEPCGIVDMGVRVFDAAEHPKDGASLALPRRMARGARRRGRRRAHRKERIKSLLVQSGMLTQKQLDTLYTGRVLEDIYALRTRALDMPVSGEVFARILIHLSQRRGFLSNRKADAGNRENGQLLSAVEENRTRMAAGGYRTAGEMYTKDPFYANHKRNKGEVYLATLGRDMVEEEARLLFARQRAFAQPFATLETEAKYLDILLSQRSFDEGPGGDSPYGGNQVEKMRGTCVFEDEKRAPKASWTFEQFRFWEKANHLRILSQTDARTLTVQEKELLYQESLKKERLTFNQIRRLLELSEDERFNTVNYRGKKSKTNESLTREEVNKASEGGTFGQFAQWHKFRKALNTVSKDRILEMEDDVLDAAAEVLSCYKQEAAVKAQLDMLPLTQDDVAALMTLPSFSGFAHLSLKACRKLLPFLREGMNYDAACTAAGYDFRVDQKEPQMLLPANEAEMEQITSPVVRRAVAQTIKVVNAIIRWLGSSPVFLNIEVAREMAKNFQERKDMQNSMEENAARNERIMQRLKDEFGVRNPTGLDLVKLRLFEEQHGRCAYGLQALDVRRLFEPGYAEIDHIIPYSLCFDDTYANKALVTGKANRDKGNRLPLQYLTGEAREKFIVHTQTAGYRARKRLNLLREKFTEEDERQFKERNLQDTKHVSRFMHNYIRKYLQFAPFATGRKQHVTPVSGGITSHLRRRWGLSKNRDEGDAHHAQDAVVIACTTSGMVATISRYYQREEAAYQVHEQGAYSVHSTTGEVFPLPWPGFRDDVTLRMQAAAPADRLQQLRQSGRIPTYDALPRQLLSQARPLFVSRMPNRKVTGPAHMDTVKGKAADDSGRVVKRVAPDSLKLENGEIKDYYRPDSDPALYNALFERLQRHNGDAKAAFAEPICKPGTTTPVRKVKVAEAATLQVPVHGGKGVADNGSMVRIDIFHVPGDGYYLIPLYVADTIKDTLPNLACVAYKPYDQWKPMQPEHFVFSLYPNDLIKITEKTPMQLKRVAKESANPPERPARTGELLYYRGCDIAVGSINGITHDNAYSFRKGVKRLQRIDKYVVDVLGRTHPVKQEARVPFGGR